MEEEEEQEHDYGDIFRGLAKAFQKAADVYEENVKLREMLSRYVERDQPREESHGLPTFQPVKPRMPF